MPHSLQICGFSPVWMRRWVFKLLDVLKPFWQKSQTYGRSPVCILTCRSNRLGRSKTLPQVSHGNMRLDFGRSRFWMVCVCDEWWLAAAQPCCRLAVTAVCVDNGVGELLRLEKLVLNVDSSSLYLKWKKCLKYVGIRKVIT